jgi:subtilisin family serine protease
VTRFIAAAAAAALVLPGSAAAGRFAIGLDAGASPARVAGAVERATGGDVTNELAPLRALVLRTSAPRLARAVPGVAYVESLAAKRRLAFTPTDPFVARQWYLAATRALDFWPQPPNLPTVRVAVVDSGLDGAHPELAGRYALAKSFVGGSPLKDVQGHGTFIAGEIAAALNNKEGIAGIAFPAQLLVAKVVRPDGTISLDAEVRAIRWAVANGAQVINLSLGGVRDPADPRRDTYSRLEQTAVEYAFSRGVVLVAAVGNSDQAPSSPWPFASYPAALPHVIGVSALARDGSIPSFSNRDAIYNDVAAPGQDLFSTFPLDLTAQQPGCTEQGYSSCGPIEYRRAEGTSFAAPQVTAAAALLLATRPTLRPEQVATLLERTAVDANPSTGCPRCPLDRDSFSGWGRLDVAGALEELSGGGGVPARDRLETNDDAGTSAPRLYGRSRRLSATIDFWDDQIDVYRVFLRRGRRLIASLRGPVDADTNLALWKPGTKRVDGLAVRIGLRVRLSAGPGAVERVAYRARATGWYYLEVKVSTPGAGPYRLDFAKQ